MLRLTPAQFDSLSRQRARTLRSRGVAILRNEYAAQCQQRTDAQLLAHVEALATFAIANQVVEADNILRLLRAQMDKGFSAHLLGYLAYRLQQEGLDEATRVRNFLAACAEPKLPQLISLATPIEP